MRTAAAQYGRPAVPLLHCEPSGYALGDPMTDLTQTLRNLHEELQQARRLGPDDRAMLETLLGDIQRLLDSQSSAAETGAQHGDALEGAAVRLEAGHPGLASAIRSVLDAIGKAGI